MGVRTLVGMADGTTQAAAMYDSASGFMIGPIFEAPDSYEQVQSFLDWMNSLQFMQLTTEIGLTSDDLPNPTSQFSASDVRAWPDNGMEKLVNYWKSEHVGENGFLKETIDWTTSV